MKQHYTQYQPKYKNYILDCLDDEDSLIGKNLTRNQKIEYLMNRFNKEYGFMVQRLGNKQKAIAEWLSGLAINIPYYNDDIIELAKNLGSANQNLTSAQESNIINNYFNFMAYMVLQLEKEISI